jgi:predicted acyltransferase
MLLMIFVNDISSVKNIPAWIEHVTLLVTGLALQIQFFRHFLFIVGLSLPSLLITGSIKETPILSIAGYIISRSIALLVMGFFHVNWGKL